MKKQLEQYFGCEVKIREYKNKLSLPIFMTFRDIAMVEMYGVNFALIDVMKEISPSEITYMNIVSPLHSEMAILFNDENTYPMSIKEADAYINCYEKYENSEKCPSYILKELKQRRYMKSVLEEGRRDEFLLHLEQRKQKTIKWLQKMGIPV